MPQRIQRKRTAGWRMPEGSVYVGRPTRWGNPFRVGEIVTPPINRYEVKKVYVRDAEHATRLYRVWIQGAVERCSDIVPILSGRDLACWCPLDHPCHADVLLELANG